jgi:hypothetical protein
LLNFISQNWRRCFAPSKRSWASPRPGEIVIFFVSVGYVMGDDGSFAIGFAVTGALILLGGVSAMLLRLPCATGADESVVRNAWVGL